MPFLMIGLYILILVVFPAIDQGTALGLAGVMIVMTLVLMIFLIIKGTSLQSEISRKKLQNK